jgi:hypothetical protein
MLQEREQAAAEPGKSDTPSTASTAASSVAPSDQAALAAGGRCAVHPERESVDVCSRCGNFFCADCRRVSFENKPVCVSCIENAHVDVWQIPWEQQRSELGWYRAYWQTASKSMFNPTQTFVGLTPHGSWWDACSFALISFILSTLGTTALYVVIGGGAALFAATNELSRNETKESGPMILAIALGVIVFLALMLPIMAFVRIYLGAGVDHLVLKMLGSQHKFDTTFRAYCYSTGPAIWGVIPFCGTYIFEIWRLVCTIFAYKNTHKISGNRASVAVLVPVGVCCGLYFASTFGLSLLGQLAGGR